MVKIGINNTCQIYDLENMKIMNERFKYKFQALETLSDKNYPYKLGVSDEKLYISWNIWLLQSIHRYYYGENRIKVSNFIKSNFDEYIIFYNMILSCIQHDDKSKNDAEQLKKENISLMTKWAKGINLLKELYKDDKLIFVLYSVIHSKLVDLLNPSNGNIDVNL